MSDLRTELLDIRARRGRLTPAIVVEEATSEDSPLHSRFEWDDEVAADAYRLEQARELIRSVRVRYTESKDSPRDVRAFVSVSRPEAPAREYVPVEEVSQDPFLSRLVLQEMERDWRTLYAKYEHLKEFIELVRKDVA